MDSRVQKFLHSMNIPSLSNELWNRVVHSCDEDTINELLDGDRSVQNVTQFRSALIRSYPFNIYENTYNPRESWFCIKHDITDEELSQFLWNVPPNLTAPYLDGIPLEYIVPCVVAVMPDGLTWQEEIMWVACKYMNIYSWFRSSICSFRGTYNNLSNFSPAHIMLDGITYPHVENAFQAMKCADISLRGDFVKLSPGQAKRYGRQVTMRTDWNEVKDDVMLSALEQKFDLRGQNGMLLKSTGFSTLIEGNTWHDNYWGRCSCRSCQPFVRGDSNHLGMLLSRIRDTSVADKVVPELNGNKLSKSWKPFFDIFPEYLEDVCEAAGLTSIDYV